MAKLTFVGLGLGERGTSLEGVAAIRGADVAYFEHYTSPHEPGLLGEVEGASGRKLTVVDRLFVEDGRRILEDARSKNVVLAVQGDPMIATTHSELRVRAIRQGTDTEVIHAATVVSAAASESGLHYYKFGRTVTYTVEEAGRASGHVYRTVHQNLLSGLHTLLLLEFDVEGGREVGPADAISGLLASEANYKRGVVSESTFAVVLSRVGGRRFAAKGGGLSTLLGLDFGDAPHCVVVPASLHFTEAEAVAAICRIGEKEVGDNGAPVRRTAQVLAPRYLEKTKKALMKAREGLGGSYADLLENVELYAKDAERFLSNNEDELAMMSIGYAEGLLDSLTFTDRFKIEW